MTIQIKHPFISLKGDGGDATLVRPSNWNAAHTTSMATLQILGRLTAGVGSFEELPTSAYIIAALAATDKATLLAALGIGAFDTGDVKMSFDPAAAAGWIAYNGEGTISKAGAGGTIRANADCLALWTILYNNVSDSFCPVSSGRGADAVTDFNAGKTMGLPRFSGRALIGAGTGSGLSARTPGQYGGTETHPLTTAELAVHSHANSLSDPGHNHGSLLLPSSRAATAGLNVSGDPQYGNTATPSAFTGMSITNANAGSGSAHNNMQPFVALWVKVKL